jgi:predicted dehydrogenase
MTRTTLSQIRRNRVIGFVLLDECINFAVRDLLDLIDQITVRVEDAHPFAGDTEETPELKTLANIDVAFIPMNLPYTPDRDPWTFMPRMPDDKAIIEAELARVRAAEEGYVLQFAQFHASLTEGRDAPVTLADGRRSLELLSALYHAAQTGQRVMLPINESHPTYRGWLAQ